MKQIIVIKTPHKFAVGLTQARQVIAIIIGLHEDCSLDRLFFVYDLHFLVFQEAKMLLKNRFEGDDFNHLLHFKLLTM